MAAGCSQIQGGLEGSQWLRYGAGPALKVTPLLKEFWLTGATSVSPLPLPQAPPCLLCVLLKLNLLLPLPSLMPRTLIHLR